MAKKLRRRPFSEAVKRRALMWCDRHCCLCNRPVGTDIEIAHIDPTDSSIEGAIPLCFDCHAAIGHYNSQHPRGRKYSFEELRSRRDQIYDQHTSHLVSPVWYRLRQGQRKLPDVGFEIRNLGETYPVRVRVDITLFQGKHKYGSPSTTGHYDGRHFWNLNPRRGCNGHFHIDESLLRFTAPIRARINVAILDIYEREHRYLPVGFVLMARESEWYFEPSIEELDQVSRLRPIRYRYQ